MMGSMQLTVEHEIRGRFLWVGLGGVWDLDRVFAVIDMIRWETEWNRLGSAFVDFRSVEGPIPDLDRFFAGERVALVLGGRVRLAVLARPEMINKLGEDTAVNRGARILVTPDEAQAIAFID
jgi:hypothetical protein